MDEDGTLRLDACNRKPNGRQTVIERDMGTGHMHFTVATREDAARVHGITQAAYAEYRGVLDPPSEADRECVADVERALDEDGAVLAWIGDTAVGAVRLPHAADSIIWRWSGWPLSPPPELRGLPADGSHTMKTWRAHPIGLTCAWGCGSRDPGMLSSIAAWGTTSSAWPPYSEGTDTWAVLAKPV